MEIIGLKDFEEPFGNFLPGDTFVYYADLYLKVSEEEEFNAVNLSENCLTWFDNDIMVIPKDVTVQCNN